MGLFRWFLNRWVGKIPSRPQNRHQFRPPDLRHWERSEFPLPLLPKWIKMDQIGSNWIKKYQNGFKSIKLDRIGLKKHQIRLKSIK